MTSYRYHYTSALTLCSTEHEQRALMGSHFVTMSGRNRGLGKANEPKFVCQICGDVAAGFHCGAYVCEACKVNHTIMLRNTK